MTTQPTDLFPPSGLHGPVHDLSTASAYMLGVGGCGMSGLARMLRSVGAEVSGCDSVESHVTNELQADGLPVEPEQGVQTLPNSATLVVASQAIPPAHRLLLEAQSRGLPVLRYPEALGLLMDRMTGVAIAGTHGKSTTAAMLGATLVDCDLDPSVIVGATCRQLRGGSLGSPVFAPGLGYRTGSASVPIGGYAGAPGLLIAEACEFNRSFHNLRPTVASIACVEADHLDVYGSLDAVVEAFRTFARAVAPADEGGLLLVGHEGAHRREITAGVRARVETIGFAPAADWCVRYDPAEQIAELSRNTPRGRVTMCRWGLRMPGEHNAFNSAVACALAISLGAEPARAARSLAAFRGLDRRCELLGDREIAGAHAGGVRVYDDYGHHPTEIDATLRALRERERPQDAGGRLICVFQPHQHSRTRFLLEEFATSFSQADVVIVPHIYFVRDSESEKHRVTAGDLVDRLRNRGVRAMHLYPFEAIVEQLENVCRAGDLLVVMGAGPVWQVAHQFLGAGGRGRDG